MRAVIVLSGDIRDDRRAKILIDRADRMLAADGGTRHLRRLNIRPDALVGDLDSIAKDDLDWIENKKIPVRKYPSEKDETDSELALNMLMDDLPGSPGDHQIIVLGAFGTRPDHVLANQLLAARLSGQGWRLILSDGRSDLYTLAGGQSLNLDLADFGPQPLAVSVLPVSAQVKGLTYKGLKYPLVKADLALGSTRGISNEPRTGPDGDGKEKTGHDLSPVCVSLDQGLALLIITPRV